MSFDSVMSSILQFLNESMDFFGLHPMYAAGCVVAALLAAAYFKFGASD
jgi:hypothetical protein